MTRSSEPNEVVPVRLRLDFCMAVPMDHYEAGVHFDQIEHALEVLPQLFDEGGTAELMTAEDVIADSPLDLYLRACKGER